MLHKEITDKVLNAFYKVYNTLGWGFLETVYRNAMALELKDQGMTCEMERHLEVFYGGEIVGDYKADIVVEDFVVLELKSCEVLIEQHKNQLINYLKASNIEIGLLLNFGKSPEFKRVIFSNTYNRTANTPFRPKNLSLKEIRVDPLNPR